MKYKLIIDKDAEEKTARSIIWVLGSKLFCLVWICYQSRLSEAVRGNFARQSYKRTQFACRFGSNREERGVGDVAPYKGTSAVHAGGGQMQASAVQVG